MKLCRGQVKSKFKLVTKYLFTSGQLPFTILGTRNTTVEIIIIHVKTVSMAKKSPCRNVLTYTPDFAETTSPLKQAFVKFGLFVCLFWLLLFQDFFLPGKYWMLFGGSCLCISSSWIQDFDNLCTFLKYILWLFLTSYINLLGNRVTPGHFVLLSWPFLLSKDSELPCFLSFMCSYHLLVSFLCLMIYW